MWLDHWDKYGYRVCDYDNVRMYRPKNADPKTFDNFESLRWLRDKAKMGLAVDPYVSKQDYAEGITCEPFLNWGENAARVEHALQSSLGDTESRWGTALARQSLYRFRAEKGPLLRRRLLRHGADAGWGNNSRTLAWYAGDAEDQLLAEVQQMIRRATRYPNLISHHLPQQEVGHGSHDMLTEWGPQADVAYRRYLREKYGDLTNLSRRWHGSPSKLTSWADVHVPELAQFEGWSPEALNIDGAWKVKRLLPGKAPPAGWERLDCPDCNWETVCTPGAGMLFGGYKRREPAVFRIRFAVPEQWLQARARQWLYVWDLNPWDTKVAFSVNGKPIAWDKGWPYVPHWMAIEVTGTVAAGSNQLALCFPVATSATGYICPAMGRSCIRTWGKRRMPVGSISPIGAMPAGPRACGGAWRRSGKSIWTGRSLSMRPHQILDEAREVAIELGGVLHDTGGMAGNFNIDEVMLSHAAGLPYSLEPGNGPQSVQDYKTFLGRYIAEGVQSVESVCPTTEKMFYDKDIRRCAEENVPLTQLIGKYHVPPAKVAYFFSNRDVERLAYPWRPDASKVLWMGYRGWCCELEYPPAALMESDFLKDRAGQFAVVFDANTQFMNEPTVDGIERYVRSGGVFVTLGQTGRHTETEADRWPISRLTGYKVLAVDPRAPDGGEHLHPGGLDDPLPDNGIFQLTRWRDSKLGRQSLQYANGLSLEKVAPECRDLIKWNDGTTAAGIRPLGRGYVIDMGVVFGRHGSSPLMKKLLEDIAQWRGVTQRPPAQIYPAVVADPASLPKHVNLAPGAVYVLSAVEAACRNAYPYDLAGFPWAYRNVLFRHFHSNNGLYDVWALHNQLPSESRTVDITFRDGLDPAFAIDVRSNQHVAITKEADCPRSKLSSCRPWRRGSFSRLEETFRGPG